MKNLLIFLGLIAGMGMYAQELGDLPEATVLQTTDVLVVEQSDATRKITKANLETTLGISDLETATSTNTTHRGLEDDPHSVTKTQVGLSNVENTKLSTWVGTTNITTLSTIIAGTWTADVIGDTYIANDITLTNITQITNRSHTSLSDIGSNTHDVIDTDIKNIQDSLFNVWEMAQTHTYNADYFIDENSDGIAGTVTALTTVGDADIIQIEEASGVNPIDVRFIYKDVESFNNVQTVIRYEDGSGHEMHVELWNVNTSGWVEVAKFGHLDDPVFLSKPVINGADYIDGDSVVVRIDHHLDNGIPSHYVWIDYLVLQKMPGLGGAGVTSHLALSNKGTITHDAIEDSIQISTDSTAAHDTKINQNITNIATNVTATGINTTQLVDSLGWLKYDTLYSADYFVSADGKDSNDGLSPNRPWKTIDKVNSEFSGFGPGDTIAFKGGDVFKGTIIIGANGNSTNPIVLTSYGTGNATISGFETLYDWTSIDGGDTIYRAYTTARVNANLVVINGEPVAMGRWPSYPTWLNYTDKVDNVSITDDGLSGSPDWDGAEVVIRHNTYAMNRNLITDHTNTVIAYDVLAEDDQSYHMSDMGYFIQDDSRTLDVLKEWYFKDEVDSLYVYFGDNEPTSYDVKIAVIDTLMLIYQDEYIVIDGLDFEGAGWSAIRVNWGTDNLVIKNCNINHCGYDGIYFAWTAGINTTVENNTIINVLNRAIRLGVDATTTITGNTIRRIGILAGMGDDNVGGYDGISSYLTGLCEFSYNRIDSIGYTGISTRGAGTSAHHNYISNVCLVKDDGGAIYAGRNTSVTYNIITDGAELDAGANVASTNATQGIYVDDAKSNVIISNNSVGGGYAAGIFIHNADTITIHNNNIFDNDYQFWFTHDGGSGSDSIDGLDVKYNSLVSKETGDPTFYINKVYQSFTDLGDIDSNYYYRPAANTDFISWSLQSSYWILNDIGLEEWQTLSGGDAESDSIDYTLRDTDILFEYNVTLDTTTVFLTKDYVSPSGTAYYNGQVVKIAPYESILLVATGGFMEINTQTDSYEIVLTDADKLIVIDDAGVNDLTIPENIETSFHIGTVINISCIGAGVTTVVPTGGVAIISRGSLLDIIALGDASLIKIDTDTWKLIGSLE